MLVIAGPPGSGKSTFFPVTGFGVDGFSIDDRCAQIVGSYQAITRDLRSAVGVECERFISDHITAQRSFAVETTFRTNAATDQARDARRHAFLTVLKFMATESVEENIRRVIARGQSGGHSASERDIRSIHGASVANLAGALAAFERVHVYDSTAPWTVPRLVASSHDGRVIHFGTPPVWLADALPDP